MEGLEDKIAQLEHEQKELKHSIELIKKDIEIKNVSIEGQADRIIKDVRLRNWIIYVLVSIIGFFGFNSYRSITESIMTKSENLLEYISNTELGRSYYENGSYIQSAKLYEDIYDIALEKKDYLSITFFFSALLRSDDYDKALNYYFKTKENLNADLIDSGMLLNNMACILIDSRPLNSKFLQDAKYLLGRAIDVGFESEDGIKYIYFNLLRLSWINGDKDKSIRYAKKIIDVNRRHYLYVTNMESRPFFPWSLKKNPQEQSCIVK